MDKTQLLLGILLLWLMTSQVHPVQSAGGKPECSEASCLADPLGFDAIVLLHSVIDDDQNGNLDREESDEYFRDELNHADGADSQATFHGSDDLINVQELWLTWTRSEVYNWTIEDVIYWLEDEVGLPKYTESFRVNAVDGHILPRLAVNSNYVSSILEIKNGVHRQKLAVKATDLVLFGQKKRHNWVKDVLLACLFIFATTVVWFARRQHWRHEQYVRKVLGDLEVLQRSEDVLKQLQHRYEETKREQQKAFVEKQNIESKLKNEISEAKNEAERLRTTREATEEEISRLKLAEQELTEVRKALSDSERCCEQLRHESLPPLVELQQWLQLSYEIETQHYENKREAAHRHLKLAREMCERVRRKRSGLLGSLRIAHSTSLDDTDHSIMQAKGALEEVKLHLEERTQRWREIENICGFDIQENPGLHVLETTLRGIGSTYLAGVGGGGVPGGMSKSPSVSTFSALNNVPADVEMDEDVSASQLQAVAGLLPPPSYPSSSVPAGLHRTNGSMANLGPMYQHPGAGTALRNYPDHRVWPNLMKAGMQLTMFGLGLTNPNLGGPVAQSRERRRTLMDTHELRHSATMPAALNQQPRSGSITKKERVSPEKGTNGHIHSTKTTTEQPAEKVKFILDDNESESSGASLARETNSSNTTALAYKKSRSVEPKAAARPAPLVSSQSDTAILAPKSSPANKGSPPKDDGGKAQDGSPESSASHGSTESLDLATDNNKKLHRKKSALKMPKIFKKKEP